MNRYLVATSLAAILAAGCSTAGKEMKVEEDIKDGEVVKRTTTGPAGWMAMLQSVVGEVMELKPPECDGAVLTDVGEVACYMAQQAFAINLPHLRMPQDSIGETIRSETANQNAAISKAATSALWLIGGVTIARIVDNIIDGATRPNSFTQNVSEEGSGELIAAVNDSGVQTGDGFQYFRSPQGGSANETNDTLIDSPPDFSGGDGESAGDGAAGTVNNVNAEGELQIDGI